MGLVQWKQIEPRLFDDGQLTGSLYLTGSFFLNDTDILTTIQAGGFFTRTGSYYSANGDARLTGSLTLELDGNTDKFIINVNNQEKLQVNEEGVLQLFPQITPPTPVSGGLYFDTSNFYVSF